MAIGVRLEFEPFEQGGDGAATVGELRDWLALVDKNGVQDDEELVPMLEGPGDELTGFCVYGRVR